MKNTSGPVPVANAMTLPLSAPSPADWLSCAGLNFVQMISGS